MPLSSNQFSTYDRYDSDFPASFSLPHTQTIFVTLIRAFPSRYSNVNSLYIVGLLATSQQTVDSGDSMRKAPGEDSYGKLSVPRNVRTHSCPNRVVLPVEGEAARRRRVRLYCERYQDSIGCPPIANNGWIRKNYIGRAVGCMTSLTFDETAARGGQTHFGQGVFCR